MRRALAGGLAVAVVVGLAAWAAAQPKKPKGTQYAFLIACSGYDPKELRPLPYTIDDVMLFKSALLETGFEEDHIIIMHDKHENRRFHSESTKIREELRSFLKGLKPEDTIILALSGHGIHYKAEKTGYFCPVDARLEDKTRLIPMEGEGGFFEILRACKAKRKLMFVSACRNDPGSDLAQAQRKVNLDDEDSDVVPEGIAALYSCGTGEKSYYDPNRKASLFFLHLTAAWRGDYHDEGSPLTLEEVFDTVTKKTKVDAYKSLGATQIPVARREYQGRWEIPLQARKEPARLDSSHGTLVAGKVREIQQAWASYLRVPVERTFDLGGGVTMEFVLVPPGKFMMGASENERFDMVADDDEFPRHVVTISQPMYVSKYEVTRGQFRRFATAAPYSTVAEEKEGGHGWNESEKQFEERKPQYTWKSVGFPQTDEHPVVNVTWEDSRQFCSWLARQVLASQSISASERRRFGMFRLLHEAEWEYSCRAGTTSRYYTGEDNAAIQKIANVADLSFQKHSSKAIGILPTDDGYAFTAPVGRFQGNALGLHDMLGNVWEWCDDSRREYRGQNEVDPVASAGQSRINRGGSFRGGPRFARSASRDQDEASDRLCNLGFRVVLVR